LIAEAENILYVGNQMLWVGLQHHVDKKRHECVGRCIRGFGIAQKTYDAVSIKESLSKQYGLGVFTKDNFATIEDADNLVPWSTIGLDLK